MVNGSDLINNPELKKSIADNIKIKLEAFDFTKQLLFLGSMGAGKTGHIIYLVEQNIKSGFKLFQSHIFNDVKGDFLQQFYREDKDYILGIHDDRAAVYDFFSEMKYNIQAGVNFTNNLYEAIAGKDKDFFSGSALQLTEDWIKEAYFDTDNNIDAWNMFFSKMKNYEEELEKKENKTKDSILQTIKITVKILEMMHYQIVIEKRKIFCIHEFVRAQDTQLFLANNEQFAATASPYISGIWGAINGAIMGKADTKEHLILNVMDEFLTMPLDKKTRDSFLMKTRSKGACNIIAAQYLPEDKDLVQSVSSSIYALVVSQINDDFTKAVVSKIVGKAEILTKNRAPRGQNGAKGASGQGIGGMISGIKTITAAGPGDEGDYTHSLTHTELVYYKELQSMPPYHHITIITSEEVKSVGKDEIKKFMRLLVFGYEKVMMDIAEENPYLEKEVGLLYLGYSPLATLNYGNPHFVPWDMGDYYRIRINNKKQIEVDSKMDERTAFKHFLSIRFAENEEIAKTYIKENRLENQKLNELFEDVSEDKEKVTHFLEKYSDEERYQLIDQFFDIPLSDLDAKYDFCKENGLIGSILGAFVFSDEFITSKLQEGEVSAQ